MATVICSAVGGRSMKNEFRLKKTWHLSDIQSQTQMVLLGGHINATINGHNCRAAIPHS